MLAELMGEAGPSFGGSYKDTTGRSLPCFHLPKRETLIHDRGEMLSLTDMWRAAGSDDAKRPANWARKEGADFIAFMAESDNVPLGHIMKGERGRNGVTFAHWQIAMAYAKYLSHVFETSSDGGSVKTPLLPPPEA